MRPAEPPLGRGWGWRARDLLRAGPRARAAVLAYHRVGEDHPDPLAQVVSPATLASHLRMLRRRWSVVSTTDVVDMVRSGRLEHGSVAVTFDDGYADNLELAAPTAADVGVPITVFVAAGPVLDGRPFWWDELWRASGRDLAGTTLASLLSDTAARPSSPESRLVRYRELQGAVDHLEAAARERLLDEVREPVAARAARPLTRDELGALADAPGVTIGAHTRHHPRLSGVDAQTERTELRARRALEEAIGRPVELVAYPFGKDTDITERTARAAEAEGYRAAFTTSQRPVVASTDPFRLPRISMAECDESELTRRLSSIAGLYATRGRR